jgi:HSP20 family protein
MNTFNKCAPQRAYSNSPFFRAGFPSFWDKDFFGNEYSAHVPAVNISENEKGWEIELSAAGFKKEDFSVKLEKDLLTITGVYKEENENVKKNYSRREFRMGSFSHSFRIRKDGVNEEGISATFENGILHVSIPKKEAEPVKAEYKEIQVC